MKEKALIEILKNSESNIATKSKKLEEARELLSKEFSLYHIQELTFEDDSPRKEGFENVLSSLRIEGIIFVYLLLGTKEGVSFYFGIAKDKSYTQQLELDVDDIGKEILKSSIEGNFKGSKVELVKKQDKASVRETITNFTRFAKVNGVPSVNEENEEFQGVDRLVDVMSNDEFGLMILANPLSATQIKEIENNLYNIHNKISPLVKKSMQTGSSNTLTKGDSISSNSSKTTGTNDNTSITETNGTSKGTSSGTTSGGSNSGTSKSGKEGENHSTSEGKTKGSSISNTTGDSTSKNNSEADGKTYSETVEFSKKHLQVWMDYIDNVLLEMVKNGKNKGLYYSNIYLLAKTKGTLLKLGNTLKSLFSGVNENKAPLTLEYIQNRNEIESIRNFQLPRYNTKLTENEKLVHLLHSKSSSNIEANWLSTNELSVVAGLPQKEVVGLVLKEEVEFGLNMKQNIADEDKLLLGNLVKSGNELDLNVYIDKNNLDKHTFIAGVTGSGKTTTCQRILNSADMPFMVIEPAKTEYRILTKRNKDMLIFTLGNDNIAPFRLNPFEFFPHENITSRVDMIKASIEAAFDMEAAIPQLIESAIYKCYEKCGWNIATSKNSKYTDPFADGVYAFPTLKDLIDMSEKVVEEQGFDERLKNDYVGSIKARLQGLLIGSKGLMLNTHRSIDFKVLARKQVILELEEIRNPSEKSLIMGFILANLNEAIRANYEEDKKLNKNYKHITLIEEAHRLLSKYEAGDSQNKKQGVETFADMLAEVRKYGEALIIVDQIPNKLTSEVLKNTNTKIIHKLFAKDDKEAVGNTMALDEEQKDFLSNLDVGRVIVSTTGINKPLQVQIKELVSTTDEESVDVEIIREISLTYYKVNYKKGLIRGLEFYDDVPSTEMVESFLRAELLDGWRLIAEGGEFKYNLYDDLQKYSVVFVVKFLSFHFYGEDKEKTEYLSGFLHEVNTNNKSRFNIDNENYLEIIKG